MQEILIMAVTRMLSGYCVAGFTREPDPVSGLRWLRPVKEHDSLLAGDITTAEGKLIALGDVVEMAAIKPRPMPPHCEDWLTDFIHHRPRVLYRLEGEKRARFFARYLDRAPEDVLIHGTRSLCLVQPKSVWASFEFDPSSERMQARLGFTLPDLPHERANSPRGVAVTDLRWGALGRSWLGERGGALQLSHQELLERLQAERIYLALGLSRSYQGQYWPLVIGVHTVPDYTDPLPPGS